MTTPEVIVHADADILASAVAARLAVRLLDAQAANGTASVVLTGGRIAEKIYAALCASPVKDAVDWSNVDLWWGDERFVPAEDADRNEKQIRDVLLNALPLSAERVHPMPASDGPDGDDPEAAAARYSSLLEAAGHDGLPHFDVVLLGIGEDGHVASIFPGHPLGDGTGLVNAVRESPKPPPIRITLTMSALCSGDEVWILASGEGKADAVGMALGAGTVPAGRVHGKDRTLWLVDRDAAANLKP